MPTKYVSLALVALLAAIAAVILAVAAFLERSGTPAVLPAIGPEPDIEVSGLKQRILELDARLSALSDEVSLLRLDRSSAGNPVRETAFEGEDMSLLAARVTALERDLTGAAAHPEDESGPPEVNHGLTDRVEELKELRRMVDDWTKVALDARASESERLNALSALEGNHRPDGTDARIAVLPEMIQLAERTLDSTTRAEVWRQLHNLPDRSLVAPLLHSLQHDASGEVRKAAVEVLTSFASDPSVKSLLQYAAEHDSSDAVRSQAAAALGG